MKGTERVAKRSTFRSWSHSVQVCARKFPDGFGRFAPPPLKLFPKPFSYCQNGELYHLLNVSRHKRAGFNPATKTNGTSPTIFSKRIPLTTNLVVSHIKQNLYTSNHTYLHLVYSTHNYNMNKLSSYTKSVLI